MGVTVRTIRLSRAVALGTCRATGVASVVRDSRWRQQRLLIIGYHGVSIEDEHEWKPSLYIPLQLFESRLDQLRRGGYSVLPLGEALELLGPGKLPKRSVVLTFDDGMYNFYRQAYPALRARGFPATVYLTTYYCEFNRPIFSLAVAYLLWKTTQAEWRPRGLFGFSGDYQLPSERHGAWLAVLRHAEREDLSGAEKDVLAQQIAESLGIDYGPIVASRRLHLMNPAEVSELAREGVDFQLHTHRHRTPTDRALIEREVIDNRQCIERLTGSTPRHFCYPNGDHKPAMSACLEQHAVRSATTCNPGLVTRRTAPLLLPRFIDTTAISPLTFEGWLTGVGAWLSRSRSYAPAS